MVVEVDGWLATASSFANPPIGQAMHWDGIGPGIDPMRWAKMLQQFPRFNGSATYNGGIYDDGTVFLWASGRTVNVGRVDSKKLARVRAGEPIGADKPGRGDVFANRVMLGWVLRNSGGAQDPITDAQRRSLIILGATCVQLYGFNVNSTVHHWELTSRKVDIGLDRLQIDLRESMRNYMAELGPIPEPGEEEDEMLHREEVIRRGVNRMEQLYRQAWGTDKVPDTNGYRWWINEIEMVADQGMDAVYDVVIKALRNGLGIPEVK